MTARPFPPQVAAARLRPGRSTKSSRIVLHAAFPVAVALLFLLPTGAVPAAGTGLTSDHSSVQLTSGAAGTGPVLESSANLTCEASRLLGTPCPSAAPARPAARPSVAGVNPKTWTYLTGAVGPAPPARYLGVMVYDPVDQYVLLFGGDSGAGLFTDTWTFSHNQWTELSVSGPPGRYVASIAWDAADGYAVMFGGSTTLAVLNDTWTFVHGTWTNITGTTNQTPDGRWRQSMTYDAGDGYVVMFGGTDLAGTTVYSDTWEFLHGDWTKLNVTGSPPGRYRATMVYDPVDNYSVLFGGCTTACPDGTTWEYHNLTWTSLSPTTHPSSRVYYAATYSPVARTVVLFGGEAETSTTEYADTWNFTNGNWTSLTSSLGHSPAAIAYSMMAYDPVDGYVLMYGGEWAANATFTNETWALGPSILGQVTVAPGAIDLGQTAAINATPIAHRGYVSYNYTTLPPGCLPANVSVLNCTPSASGSFPVNVTLNDSGGVLSLENTTLVVNPDPVVSSFVHSAAQVTVGSVVTFSTNVSGGTAPLSYRYTGLPAGCSSVNRAVLNCTPTAAGPATLVTVNVTDAVREYVTASVTVSVNARPDFTGITALPSLLDVGESLHITSILAGGTAPVTYDWIDLPPGCPSVNASSVTCTPTGASNGLIGLVATDADGWAANTSVLVTVAADPMFTSGNASPAAVDVGTPVHLWANVTGGTGADTFQYSGEPTGCSLANSPANSCTPTETGTFTVEAEVTDTTGFSVFENFSFTVRAPVSLEEVTTSPAAIDLGQNVTFSAAPVGGTTPYSYDFVGLPQGCAAVATSNATTCVPRTAGTYTVTVTVTDALGLTSMSKGSVVVHPDPSISSFGPSTNPTTIGSTVQIVTNATNGSSVYSYSYRGLPTGCATGNTNSLPCTPTATGSFIVTVTVHDSLGETTSAQAYVNVTAKTSNTLAGLPATTFDLLVVGLVALLVVVALVVVLRRRPATPPPPKAPDEWAEPEEPAN
jgi:hypothetical protein